MKFVATLVLQICLCVTFASYANSHQILTSPLLTNWGTWGSWERCPAGTKVISVQVLTEPWHFWDVVIDDTCMNAVKMVCGDPRTGSVSQMITSKVGNWGRWGNMHRCNGNGFAVGFMLRSVEGQTATVDESATNNLRILCSGSTTGFVELDGEEWGEWTNPRICDSTEYICGIQTQVEDPQGIFSDDTALNNIRVECCDLTMEELVYYGLDVQNATVAKN